MSTATPYAVLYAHRGLSSLFPENSLTAFTKTVEYGIPGIELDIQWLADGVPAVWHDESIERFFIPPESGKILLSEFTSEELSALLPVKEYDHPGIPLFTEVLEALDGKAHLDIEIKYYSHPSRDQLTGLKDLIEKHNYSDRSVISSFDPRILLDWRNIGSPVPCGLIYDEESKSQISAVAPWETARAAAHFEKPLYTMKKDIETALQEKRTVIPWTVDDTDTGEALLKAGARGIISNTPQSYRTLLTRSSAINLPS